MGWNTSALFIKRPKQQVIEAVAGMFEPTDSTVGWEDASSWRGLDPNLALTGVGLWTVAWCPSWECIMSPAYEALRCALSRGGAVLGMIWSSVASSYGFRYYVDGGLVREIMYENGKPHIEHGDPIDAEADIDVPTWGPDEAWCFTIIDRLVPGFDLEAPCQLLRFVSGEPSGWTGGAAVAKKPAKPVAKKPAKSVAKQSAKPAAKKPAKPVAKKSAKPAAKKPAKPAKKAAKKPAKPAKKSRR